MTLTAFVATRSCMDQSDRQTSFHSYVFPEQVKYDSFLPLSPPPPNILKPVCLALAPLAGLTAETGSGRLCTSYTGKKPPGLDITSSDTSQALRTLSTHSVVIHYGV